MSWVRHLVESWLDRRADRRMLQLSEEVNELEAMARLARRMAPGDAPGLGDEAETVAFTARTWLGRLEREAAAINAVYASLWDEAVSSAPAAAEKIAQDTRR